MANLLLYLTTLLQTAATIDAANVLAFMPLNVRSHLQLNEAVVRSLVSAGHQVTYVTIFPPTKPLDNCTVIKYPAKKLQKKLIIPLDAINKRWFGTLQFVIDDQLNVLCNTDAVKIAVDRLKSEGKKFDIVFISAMFFPRCLLPVAQAFDAPVVGTITLRSHQQADALMGNPRNPATTAFDFGGFYPEVTFYTRLSNAVNQLIYKYLFRTSETVSLRKNFPHFDENRAPKLSLLMLNGHCSIVPRALQPNTIEVAGLHISPVPEILPKHIQTFLDEAEHGAIIMSFGTVMQSNVMNSNMKILLMNVFAKLPERVIWKNGEIYENMPANVLSLEWLPQRDILAHKNIKAFVTHCGLFGIYEAIYEGKPLVMMPFNIDQPGNAAIMLQKGVGVYVDRQTLTEEKLLTAIRKVVDDKYYLENMRKLSKLFKDRPMTPHESLIYWTDYVIRHKGASYMQTATINMPFYQYFLLDVILFFVFILFAIFSVFYVIIKRIVSMRRPKLEYSTQPGLKKLN